MTDWLTYEWELHGERATFRVDMQYWELLPVLSYSQLVYVCVAPRDPLAKGFNRMEQYRFRQLRHRLIDELEGRAIHVGSVYADTLRTLYFYAAETDAIQLASAICREYGTLAITCAQAGCIVISFLTIEDRNAFLKEVSKLGFTPGGTSWDGESTHPACCTVSGFTSLSLQKLNRFTARAISAAAPMEGMLTDIEAEFVKRY